MSEFTEAKNLRCHYCGTRFASCEGTECDCYAHVGECPCCGGVTWDGECKEGCEPEKEEYESGRKD